jgi:hypothetical protein
MNAIYKYYDYFVKLISINAIPVKLPYTLRSIHTERVTARHASCQNGILYKDAS